MDKLLILNLVCADGFVSNESVRFVLNKHKFEIADLLKEMCNEEHKTMTRPDTEPVRF